MSVFSLVWIGIVGILFGLPMWFFFDSLSAGFGIGAISVAYAIPYRLHRENKLKKYPLRFHMLLTSAIITIGFGIACAIGFIVLWVQDALIYPLLWITLLCAIIARQLIRFLILEASIAEDHTPH